jgi:hypothetical protein
MNEQQCLERMVPPGKVRPSKWRGGVCQVLITSSCNLGCFNCTQGSQYRRVPWFMTVDQFDLACESLAGYWGVVGVFGGCPTVHPKFPKICEVLRSHFPREQRGLWANALHGHGKVCRQTFDPGVSNLNVHLDAKAYAEFKRDWPESRPFGLAQDSRHSPVFGSMIDLGVPEEERWERISRCDINQHWSALVGVFRGQLRAWFCEIAGAQSIAMQDDPDYPDTGVPIQAPSQEQAEAVARIHEDLGMQGVKALPGMVFSGHFPMNEPAVQPWWKLPMMAFADQVLQHCHNCLVPMKGYGELAQTADPDAREQITSAYAAVAIPKRKGRRVELVTVPSELGRPLPRTTDYLQNSRL